MLLMYIDIQDIPVRSGSAALPGTLHHSQGSRVVQVQAASLHTQSDVVQYSMRGSRGRVSVHSCALSVYLIPSKQI